MKRLILVLLAVTFLALAGCAAQTDVSLEPASDYETKNVATFNYPFEVVWHAAIESIGKDFFMIDNIEKASRIITLAYSTDEPSDFIDCGAMHVKPKNTGSNNAETANVEAKSKITSFPYAKGKVSYPAPTGGPTLGTSYRTAGLSGKMNIIFTPVGDNKTSVSVSAKYIFTSTDSRQQYLAVGLAGMYVPTAPITDTANFNSGQKAYTVTREALCVPKGTLEKRLLDGIGKTLSR